MKYEIIQTSQFKKDLKTAIKRNYDIGLLDDVIGKLSVGEQLPEHNKDHKLIGNYKSYRECHITSDWLLIYKIDKGTLVLLLTRTGTHSDLLRK